MVAHRADLRLRLPLRRRCRLNESHVAQKALLRIPERGLLRLSEIYPWPLHANPEREERESSGIRIRDPNAGTINESAAQSAAAHRKSLWRIQPAACM